MLNGLSKKENMFAEYAIGADFQDLQLGQSTFDYLISTRMGDNTKLEIVIYVMRPGANAR